jgi:predicted PurR-regulated permease PerM
VKGDLTRIVLAVLVLAMLVGGSLWILLPFLLSLVWATLIVVSTWPLMRSVEAMLFGRRALAATVMTGAFLLLFAVPIGYGVTAVVEHVPRLVARLKQVDVVALPAPPEWLARVPVVGRRITSEWQAAVDEGPQALSERVTPYARVIGAWLLAQLGGLGLLVVHLLLTLVLVAILYVNGESAAEGVRRFARRLAVEQGDRAVTIAGQSIRAVALGIIVTAVVQAALVGLGLAVTGVPYALALTTLAFMLCLAQLGPLLVLLPAIVWLYWQDANVAGTALLVWSLIVGSLDNILRPILIRRGADLPLILIMAGVIGGLLAFGVVGLFVGPVVLAVSYRLLDAWIAVTDGRRSPHRDQET